MLVARYKLGVRWMVKGVAAPPSHFIDTIISEYSLSCYILPPPPLIDGETPPTSFATECICHCDLWIELCHLLEHIASLLCKVEGW